MNNNPLKIDNKAESIQKMAEKFYKLEAEIEQVEFEIKRHKRAIKRIERSRLWKFAKWKKKAGPPSNEHLRMIKLEKKLESSKDLLYEIHSQINLINVDNKDLNTYKVMQILSEEHKKGELLNFIKKLVEQKIILDNNYVKTFHYAARLFKKKDQCYKNLAIQKMLEGLKIEDISEIMVRSGLTDENPLPLKKAASFRASLTMRMRQKQLTESLLEWPLDNKATAYKFVDLLKIKRPKTSDQLYSVDNLPYDNGIVIKPVDGAGSRGVYLVHNENK